ncbi:hypothetical protein DY000_02008077 [Brassica cretica]|uniref:t-SNARE coiled-coil homology domain-containing protein n=1 Tax=Brassica cretica TaxID=69181 RepID=A0ABQ7BUG0_BRACR|nr:hypothetical protein DY000_02008077 [Brassica cretica]
MTVINIIFRVEEICKKYDKYDVDKQRELGASGDDAFSRLFNSIDTDIESVVHKAELASTETNRAAAVALNAEVKGLTKEERESRCDLVIALADRIQVIPDGHQVQANNEWGGASAPNKNIKFDISEGLDALKNLARDMNEELDKQVPLMDEMETKVDGATSDLKNTNVRLKQQLVKMRSSRNFCIDIILLCVVLGIISYIYNALN